MIDLDNWLTRKTLKRNSLYIYEYGTFTFKRVLNGNIVVCTKKEFEYSLLFDDKWKMDKFLSKIHETNTIKAMIHHNPLLKYWTFDYFD